MTPQEARERSHAYMARHQIEFDESLPLVDVVSELKPPNAQEVAIRSLILGDIISVAFDADRQFLRERLKAFGLLDHLTEWERALLDKEALTEQDAIDASWRTEGVQVLAWAMELTTLDPMVECDEDLASHFPVAGDESPLPFIENAKLRPFEDIYLEWDLVYCLHEASLKEEEPREDGALDVERLQERHRALAWLAGAQTWEDGS